MNEAPNDPTPQLIGKAPFTELAFRLACERIADSGQAYEEANTPEGWMNLFLLQARLGVRLLKDGNAWCAIQGPDLQEGKAAFGDTPGQALLTWQRTHGKPYCCLTGCEKDAEWRVHTEHPTDPYDGTDACSEHLGLLLDCRYAHRVTSLEPVDPQTGTPYAAERHTAEEFARMQER